ncbi:MAG: hypothetical protein BMS9Abin13_129 [Patescibacteria group bacterium]|nr:MAG: hypothetical protein BMS9Abin13_129 [Patescibacteria group bacterium]
MTIKVFFKKLSRIGGSALRKDDTVTYSFAGYVCTGKIHSLSQKSVIVIPDDKPQHRIRRKHHQVSLV